MQVNRTEISTRALEMGDDRKVMWEKKKQGKKSKVGDKNVHE